MGFTMPWPLISRTFPWYPIFFNNFDPIFVVCLFKVVKSSSWKVHEIEESIFTLGWLRYNFPKASSLAYNWFCNLFFSFFASCRSLLSSTFSSWMLWLISSSYLIHAEFGALFILGTISTQIFVSSLESEPKSMGPSVAIQKATIFISSHESDPRSIGPPP